MLNRIFIFIFVALGLCLQAEDLFLVLDKSEPLENFRSLDSFDLKASGSAQFSEEGLNELLKKLDQKDVVIVDLREEPHGFINGLPVSWMTPEFDWPASNGDVEALELQERDLLKKALHEEDVKIYKVFKQHDDEDNLTYERTAVETKVKEVSTESNLAAKLSVGYVRIPVEDHHGPKDADVDTFIIYYMARPANSWTHFHCRGGKGRTSTFLTMVDMMAFAKKLSFDEIMAREMKINQINFKDPTTYFAKKFQEAFEARYEFLKAFYSYCKENDDDYQTSWTSWKKSQS